uniref:Uncharacterized protein n=1 Tax=Arundo donax TaxID=35708 RepID=A0A0A9HNI2_ARUDO
MSKKYEQRFQNSYEPNHFYGLQNVSIYPTPKRQNMSQTNIKIHIELIIFMDYKILGFLLPQSSRGLISTKSRKHIS